MGLIVQKFGGTSVGNTKRLSYMADIVIKELSLGNQVIVVVSAMEGVTDSLIQQINNVTHIGSIDEKQEYDSILAAGEQMSSGLLALSLRAKGIHARSWLSWQLPIKTNNHATKGKILEIDTKLLREATSKHEVPIIAGFQGLSCDNRIVTLGRGGSDTTAAAVAATMNADRCDIYTDVEGVYTADPFMVHKAHKLNYVTYEEMLELSHSGSKVLHSRAIEIAMKYNLKMQVLSSFVDLPGTTLVENEDDIVEKPIITGISSKSDSTCITLKQVTNLPNTASLIWQILADNNIAIDMVIQGMGETSTDISFTISTEQLDFAISKLSALKSKYLEDISIKKDMAKVALIGIGIKNNPLTTKKMFDILAEKGINIFMVSASEIKINVLISDEYEELAVRALHTGFGLDR